ncbi:hypothetical protein SK128_016998 [Halocaridina rubra]|uniref:Uncharacterized protein n=1 Tax=Halocaridina rubra TaxID=373956 RepID=A0AAN9A881_HALRR
MADESHLSVLVEEPPRRRAYSETRPRPIRVPRHRSVSPGRNAADRLHPFSGPLGPLTMGTLPVIKTSGVEVGSSSSPFAGIVVGSPLGSGPLNGCALPLIGISSLGSSPPSPSLSTDLLCPMRRPRLSSTSEAPTVAPIPENLPLPDTPTLQSQELQLLPTPPPSPQHFSSILLEDDRKRVKLTGSR